MSFKTRLRDLQRAAEGVKTAREACRLEKRIKEEQEKWERHCADLVVTLSSDEERRRIKAHDERLKDVMATLRHKSLSWKLSLRPIRAKLKI